MINKTIKRDSFNVKKMTINQLIEINNTNKYLNKACKNCKNKMTIEKPIFDFSKSKFLIIKSEIIKDTNEKKNSYQLKDFDPNEFAIFETTFTLQSAILFQSLKNAGCSYVTLLRAENDKWIKIYREKEEIINFDHKLLDNYYMLFLKKS